MIKNYIFDFGNVLANFYAQMLTAPYVSDEKARAIISDVVFDRLYWDKLDMGTITDEEVKECIRKRLPEELMDIGCLVYDNWIKTLTPVEGMENLVCDIHKSGKKIYLLSNISKGFAQSYKNVKWIKNLLSMFDGLVMSGTICMAKPDKKIFEYILKTYNLNPSECLFIDDRQENISAAESVGIKGYLFDGDAKKLREYIEF